MTIKQVSVEKLLDKIPSIYKLVILASRRTFDLNEGAPTMVGGKFEKTSQAALEEIRQGLVTYKEEGKK